MTYVHSPLPLNLATQNTQNSFANSRAAKRRKHENPAKSNFEYFEYVFIGVAYPRHGSTVVHPRQGATVRPKSRFHVVNVACNGDTPGHACASKKGTPGGTQGEGGFGAEVSLDWGPLIGGCLASSSIQRCESPS